MQMNRSLIRGTSRYFGANISTQLPAISLETFRGIASSNGTLTGIAQLFHTQIGPYLSIDSRIVSIPSDLLKAYNQYIKTLYSQLVHTEHLNLFCAMKDVLITPIPISWSNMTYLAGDPMCTAGVPTLFVQQSFDFTIDCSRPSPLTLNLSRHNILFALIATQATPTTDKSICSLTTTPLQCLAAMSSGREMLKNLVLPQELIDFLRLIPAQIIQTKVGLMQYGVASGNWYLMHQALLEDDFNWNFLGWCFLAEWAAGIREVVSFEGDITSIVLISNTYSEQKYLASGETTQNATTLVLTLVKISTGLSIFVATLTLLSTFAAKSSVVWTNLFYFNRLVGSIWIGRPLALLRGLSAIFILGTSQLSLSSTNGYTKFIFQPRPLLYTIVIAGEANWIVYVLTDILVVVFGDTTRIYAPLSSVAVWCIVVGVELYQPVQLVIDLDRRCIGNDMDYGLYCSSGRVQVGSYDRVWNLLCIQVIGVLIIAICCTMFRKPSIISTRLFLSSAPDILAKPLEIINSQPCYDYATCTICGILPLPSRYQFDLTLWTVLMDHPSGPQDDSRVIPMIQARTVGSESESQGHLKYQKGNLMDRIAKRWRKLIASIAFGHMLFAIGSSISYFEVVQVNLANDYYWAGFNLTGTHSFFASWLNEQLIFNSLLDEVKLDSPSIISEGSFDKNPAFVTSTIIYGALVQHYELNTIGATINGLRISDACMMPWIFTPYCYLDLNQTWHIAHTSARQLRCKNMTTNAAIYLETVLRNTQWHDFRSCWGSAFDIAYGNDLQQTTQGQTWLNSISMTWIP
ncbi:hypothetical protein THRCLA_21516, partial [Thraustotheca clavata]